MVDISKFTAPKSDQLNADDLIAGPRDIVIREVREMGGEQPIAIFFEGDNGKPYKPCKSMMRALLFVWGQDATQYVGRALRLWRDPSVTWGGEAIGGIRISHMSHIAQPETFPLSASKGKRKLYTVDPMPAPQARKSLDDHVASYAAALGRAEDMSALLELVAGEGAAKLKGAVDKAGRDDLKQRMADAESARRAALEEAFDDGQADDAADDIASATERELDDVDPFGDNAD